jgi:hypothetical protein
MRSPVMGSLRVHFDKYVILAASEVSWFVGKSLFELFIGEFDPGSGRTLAACLTHASQGARKGHRRTGA